MNQDQPLVHAMAALFTRLRVETVAEDGTPFTVDRANRVDIVVLAGERLDAPKNHNREKGLSVEVTHTAVPTRRDTSKGGAFNIDGFAAVSSKTRKSARHTT